MVPSGAPLTVELGPGLLGSILDGVGRPLARLAAAHGDFIAPGATAPTLNPARRWDFTPVAQVGDRLVAGDVVGTVEEQPGIVRRILVPSGAGGALVALVGPGPRTVRDELGRLADGTVLRLAHHGPCARRGRSPSGCRRDRPMVTGQRVFDLLFPLAEGSAIAVPGGFGTGKTVIEHGLARHAAADIVVFVGCGERGNEIAEVVQDFPRLVNPRTGRPVIARCWWSTPRTCRWSRARPRSTSACRSPSTTGTWATGSR